MVGNSLKFGTSGLRGLSVDLQGEAARRYTSAFIAHLEAQGDLGQGRVFVARDLRDSSAGIAADCAAAIAAAGLEPIDCGILPTPALALHAMAAGAAAIMVTGSHIPSDRNGLKFYTPHGEITKADEAGIAAALGSATAAQGQVTPADESAAARARYLQRYAALSSGEQLAGRRIGVFEHSSVARDILVELFEGAGAQVVRLGRVEDFVALDTEAFGDAVFAPLRGWIAEHRLDAIVSADGDGDRPLLMDADGNFVRGDVLGLLAARYLNADVVVTPVTSNSAIERTGYFPSVRRTRVGSPYVIADIEQAIAAGAKRVVGFEANGGTFVGTDLKVGLANLTALATRDAVLPLLAALTIAAETKQALAQIVAALPVRAAAANRLEHVPQDRTAALLSDLQDANIAARFFADVGSVQTLSTVDGLQFTLSNGDIVHYRASGNAPELRCYVEAATDAEAARLLDWGLRSAAKFVR